MRKILFVLDTGETITPKQFARMYRKVKTGQEEMDLLPESVAKAIRDKREIIKSMIEECEITSILRVASRNSFVERCVKRHLGWRSLPINLYPHNKKSNGLIKLFDHQLVAIKHIREREQLTGKREASGMRGSILKLEMGLGKSLTAIAWSLISSRDSYPCEKHGANGYPTLVVASKALMLEWKTEAFEKFFGDRVKVLYFHRDFIKKKGFEETTIADVVKYDFVVTTYDVVSSAVKERDEYKTVLEMGDDHTLMAGKIASIRCRTRNEALARPTMKGGRVLFYTPWERVIADESQRFANPTTFLYKAMMNLYGKYKLCLTGTPIRNKDLDLWAQLRWIGYNLADRPLDWKRYARHNKQEYLGAILSIDTNDTHIRLPEKIVYNEIVKFKPGKHELAVYQIAQGIAMNVIDDAIHSLVSYACAFAVFTRLRQICIAPYLVTPESKRVHGKTFTETTERFKSLNDGIYSKWIQDKYGSAGIRSTKMKQIIKTIKNIPENEKVVVFSSFTSCLDLVALAISEFLPNIEFIQVDGATSQNDREFRLNQFRTAGSERMYAKICMIKSNLGEHLQLPPDIINYIASFIPQKRVLLMSYKVGSEGLNLTVANHVICIEPWWTFAVPMQAEARCHRPGQTKPVYVHNICVEDTIEKRILDMCNEKRDISDKCLDGTQGMSKTKATLDVRAIGRILGMNV